MRSCSPSAATFPVATSASSTTASARRARTPYQRDGALRLADGLWVVGDPAGPELHTHQGHYQGELAVRMALGEDVVPDYRALPRATYMDPEAAFVGVSLDQARGGRSRRLRVRRGLPDDREGLLGRGRVGHVTIVVDRATRELVGAAMACPDASAAIHECVLAIKARVPVDVLAETIHAFPSTSRILNGLFAEAKGDARRRRGLRSSLSRRPRRRRGPAAAARATGAPPVSTGSASAAAGSTTRSARWPGHEPAPVALARASAPGPRTPPAASAHSESAFDGPERRRPRRPARRVPGHRAATPGHGSTGSTGARCRWG